MSQHGVEPRDVDLSIDGRRARRYRRLFRKRDWERPRKGEGRTPSPTVLGKPPGQPRRRKRRTPGGLLYKIADGGLPGAMPAGYAFLGQFIAHDITFDPTSIHEQRRDPEIGWNFRTPALDLDSVYAGGPGVAPYLYDYENPAKFVLSSDFRATDVPRNPKRQAIVADPRNDQTIILSQLHLAFLKFHNQVVDELRERSNGWDSQMLFERAHEIVCWHYQWIVLNDYLPTICDEEVLRYISRKGRTFYRWEDWPVAEGERSEPFIPVEFSHAAFHFGHSQVRPYYCIKSSYESPLFDREEDVNHVGDVRGRRSVTEDMTVDWSLFFGPRAQTNGKIDNHITKPLFNLPDWALPIPQHAGTTLNDRSLPYRTLLRGKNLGLPSGQDVQRTLVKKLGKTVAKQLGFKDFPVWKKVKPALDNKNVPAPLWLYVLSEADAHAEGEKLGPVGTFLVAEVLLGLLEGDPESLDRTFAPVEDLETPNTWKSEADWTEDKRSRKGRSKRLRFPPGRAENPFTIIDLLNRAAEYDRIG